MGTGRPLVSIVTPTYNMADFLRTTIMSVAAQQYDNIEYIVVDGGSDEATPALVEQHRDVVDQYIREPDAGQSAAINKGFRAARGDIVAWLNADDYYFPEAVSRAVELFEAQPDLDIFYGDAVYVDREGQFLRYFTEVEPEDPDRLRTACDYICQPTTFFRKRCLARVGLLDERLHFTMDWELWCRMAQEGRRFHYERALIAVNRQYAETKTSSGGLKRLAEILKVNLRYKTSVVPRAFLTFAHHDLPQRIPWSAPLFRSVSALKRAIVGRRQIPPLYGLYHHSPEAGREVRVSLPTPERSVATVELLLGLPDGLSEQRISVHANERLLGTVTVTTAGIRESFQVEPNGDKTNGRFDLVLRAELPPPDSAREVYFLLEQVRLATV